MANSGNRLNYALFSDSGHTTNWGNSPGVDAPGNTTASDFATGYVNTGRAALTSSGYPVTFDTTLLAAGIIVPRRPLARPTRTGWFVNEPSGARPRPAAWSGCRDREC